MEKIYSVIIVGGGASGVLSAIELTQGENKLNGDSVLILEKNDRILKKLIATGNGQANLSNANLTIDNYYGDKSFLNEYFTIKSNFSVEDYFLGLGLPFTTLLDGRKYPLSRQANAVVDLLRFTLDGRGVNTLTNQTVNSIAYKNGLFAVSTDKTYLAKKVILSVGGKASKQFGTDGKSYSLATNFGHKLTTLFPSLVQIKTEADKIRGLKGIKEVALVTALDGDKPLKSATGDLLFTEYGVSGNAVFQISGHLASAKNPKIKIEFLPELSKEDIENILISRKKVFAVLPKEDALIGVLHKKLGQVMIKTIGSTDPKILANSLKNFTLTVTGTTGFDNAQVTKGGIATDKVNPKTMESTLQKGLYITGEMLDIDGDCGGYNLDFAFTSAYLAGKDIKKNI